MAYEDGYKMKVTDEELVSLIDLGITNSVGDFLNSSDLARERQYSTYEFAGVPELHLRPNGVSRIVSTCLLYTSPSPRDRTRSRMPSSA